MIMGLRGVVERITLTIHVTRHIYHKNYSSLVTGTRR
jgi:hypothetical protein